MGMLRNFPGGRHPRQGARRFSGPRFPTLPAFLLAAGIGCTTQQFNLAEQAKTDKAEETKLFASTSLSQDTQADSDRPNVSRLQKPETESSKSSSHRSILDQATYQTTTQSNGEVAARIRATVNGTPILDEELREAVYPYLMATQNLPEPERTARRKDAFDKQLKQLIEREVILQDMFARLKDKPVLGKLKEAAGKEFDKKILETKKAMKIKTDEEMKAFFRAQGLSLQGVRRQVERNFMAMEYMRNRVLSAIERIGHERIREYYDGHPEEFQVDDSVIWQDIFVDAGKYPDRAAARQFALGLIDKAKAGADFRQLVTQFDQGNSSYLNGEGYGHRKGEIKPAEAEPLLFQMREGDMRLVELTNGFHVVRLVKREYAGAKPFDDKTQTAIRNKLQSQVWEREYQHVLDELKRKATIEIAANPQ
jgi:hypothetical protein